MPDTTFKDLLERINNDLEELESVQKIVGDLATNTKKLEKGVEELLGETEVYVEELQGLLQKNKELLQVLKDLNLSSIKEEILQGLERFRSEFFQNQEAINKAIAKLLNEVDSTLGGINSSVRQMSHVVESKKEELSEELAEYKDAQQELFASLAQQIDRFETTQTRNLQQLSHALESMKNELSEEFARSNEAQQKSHLILVEQNNRIESALTRNRNWIIGLGAASMVAILTCFIILVVQVNNTSEQINGNEVLSKPQTTDNEIGEASTEESGKTGLPATETEKQIAPYNISR